ncbi:MAG: TlpA family protein disulfide reductase [Flavobacteriaceae bacterium]|nr:TlpA family protein disulfide reductase [Flavobacteriaceae bacterium]
MKKTLILFVIICIIGSCKKELKEIPPNKNKINNELVILISNPEKIKTNFGSGIFAKNFSQINIDTDKEFDTIKIKLKDYKKLYIKNRVTFKVAFGEINDTLNLKINKKDILINYQNRILKKYDTVSLKNLYIDNAKEEIIAHNKLFKKYYSKNIKTNIIEPIKNQIAQNLTEFKELDNLAFNKLNKKEIILKTLLDKGLISNPNYFNEVTNLKYKYYNNLLEKFLLTDDAYYSNRIKNIYFSNNDAIENAFLSYAYMNLFIANIILKQKAAFNLDYAKAFDKLPEYFTGDQLKVFREFCFNQIAKNSGESEKNTNYFKKFKEFYPNDTTTLYSLSNRYSLNSRKANHKKNNVYLLNSKNNELTLAKLISNYKGKLVYVDFWASWCAPCIAEMPMSKILQKEYNKKGVVFIYISTDKDKEAWKNASKNLKIKDQFSFLATNYPKSDFYKDLKLNSIPRYLVFDRNGKLIHENAPRPSSSQIKNLFDKLINKSNWI